jgi:transcriptional regulator with XRE-family HTH domain
VSALGDSSQRRRLAGELKRLRLASGLTGYRLADALGVTQPTISRIENGQQVASLTQVTLWCKATDAPAEQQAALTELAGDILAGPRSWEDETGSTDAQPELRDLEARTRTRSEFEPAVLPGLLQTAAYAARVLSSGPRGTPPDLAGRTMNRVTRQQILYDESKQFRFVIPETVLRWPFGPPDDPAVAGEHREQLARIEAVMGRPNVMIGILPLAPSPVWRLAGFSLYEDVTDGEPMVHLEWLTRPYNLTEPDQVEMCRQAFSNLLGASVTGDAARELITSASRHIQVRLGSGE